MNADDIAEVGKGRNRKVPLLEDDDNPDEDPTDKHAISIKCGPTF